MFKRYHLVVFDWEGTIAENVLGYMVLALSKVAKRFAIADFDLLSTRLNIRYGLKNTVQKLFPTLTAHQQEAICNEVQVSLLDGTTQVALIAGVEPLIKWLHASGMQVAIATNKSAQGLASVLAASGLQPYIQVSRSASEVPAKPCPQMLEEIMMDCGVTPYQTLMVGDSSSDMEMAALLGVFAIGMDFFHMEASALRAAGANEVMQDYGQLLDYIKEN